MVKQTQKKRRNLPRSFSKDQENDNTLQTKKRIRDDRMIKQIKKRLGFEERYLTVQQMQQLSKLNTYHVPLNKWVLLLMGIAILGCIATPGTNLFIPGIIKLGMRFA